MFKNLKVLDSVKHKQLKYNSVNDFSFAKKESVCPIMFNELIKAARHFPIVFPVGGTVIPQAVLSIQRDGNNYVAEDGKWQGPYLPMHLRRYPFVLGQTPDEEKMLVMYDADAPQFQGEKGKALFRSKDGKTVATKLLSEIQQYLIALDNDYQKTKQLFKELQQHDVLKAAQIKVTDNQGKSHTVKGFAIVDWEKVKQLDDATLASWTRSGLIQFIHIHLLSLEGLVNRK